MINKGRGRDGEPLERGIRYVKQQDRYKVHFSVDGEDVNGPLRYARADAIEDLKRLREECPQRNY